MTCAGFEDRIALYVGGDLAAEEVSAVMEHLRVCQDCAQLARDLGQDREWLASRPPEVGAVDFAAMRREIRREITRPWRGWKWLAVAAAILLAVGVGLVRRTPKVVAPDRSLAVVAPQIAPPVTPQPVEVREVTPPKRAVQRRIQPIPAESGPPVEIHLVTRDPNVTIILLHENRGVLQ